MGKPTGQMQEETRELLDEYNETYCWEYNDMVDFIKEYGEKKFRDYYEDYYRAVDDLGEDIVNAFIEVFYIESIGSIEESYQGIIIYISHNSSYRTRVDELINI